MIQTPTGTSWDQSDKRSLLVSGAIIAREYLALYPRRIAFAIILMLAALKVVGATHYLSGTLGRNYLEPEAFARHGITFAFQDYRHPVYGQAYPGFEPNMA